MCFMVAIKSEKNNPFFQQQYISKVINVKLKDLTSQLTLHDFYLFQLKAQIWKPTQKKWKRKNITIDSSNAILYLQWHDFPTYMSRQPTSTPPLKCKKETSNANELINLIKPILRHTF